MIVRIKLLPDKNYLRTFHSPRIEAWILGFLKARHSLGRVLDIGCGLGFWGFMLKTYVGNSDWLAGLDISESKLRRLKALNIYDMLVVADALKPSFREKCFDTLMAVEVLHGSINNDILGQLESLLRRDGVLVLALPGLPRGFGISKLIASGYDVYAYIL